jgi:hypothetical protein
MSGLGDQSASALIDSAADDAAVHALLSQALAERAGIKPGASSEATLRLLGEAVGAPSTTLCGYVFKEVGSRGPRRWAWTPLGRHSGEEWVSLLHELSCGRAASRHAVALLCLVWTVEWGGGQLPLAVQGAPHLSFPSWCGPRRARSVWLARNIPMSPLSGGGGEACWAGLRAGGSRGAAATGGKSLLASNRPR